MLKINGINRLRSKLKKYPGVLSKWSRAAMVKSVLDVRKQSALWTPVDTGNLRGSMDSKVCAKSHDVVTGTVWYSANYAVYVHEKTWTRLKNGRHKFLENAVYTSKARIKRNFSMALRKGISEVSR